MTDKEIEQRMETLTKDMHNRFSVLLAVTLSFGLMNTGLNVWRAAHPASPDRVVEPKGTEEPDARRPAEPVRQSPCPNYRSQ